MGHSPPFFEVINVVSSGKGRLFRRKDGKYLVYLPVYLCTDSQFPFKGLGSVDVLVSFDPKGSKRLIVEPYIDPSQIEKVVK